MYNVHLANILCYIPYLFCYISCYALLSVSDIERYIMLNLTYCVDVSQA